MSDQPNNPTPPPGQNRGPGESPGFNWRLLGLLSVAVVILGIAYFTPAMTGNVESLSYAEFRTAWDQGRVITEAKDKPLQVIKNESSSDVQITGWVGPEMVPANASVETKDFQVVLDAGLQEEVRAVVGEGVVIDKNTPLPEGESVQTLSFADFRKAWALKEVTASSLRIISKPEATVLVGTQNVPSSYVAAKDQKTGKPQAERQFSVTVSSTIFKEPLEQLLSSKASYKKDPAYLRSAISMFLPFILVIALLFFLFRQQKKSAGRGAMSCCKS